MHTDRNREEHRSDCFNHVVSSEWAASGLKVTEWQDCWAKLNGLDEKKDLKFCLLLLGIDT
jgi:hypothetical protein